MRKILRSLPARWRPKVTAIEEAKDLNTLSVEDLVSSLKVHELSLNKHESAKKSKSIALPSKGKSLKALKVIESKEKESPDGDSDEDPAEMMAMLSNRLQYLAKKNKKFLSRRNSYKGRLLNRKIISKEVYTNLAKQKRDDIEEVNKFSLQIKLIKSVRIK